MRNKLRLFSAAFGLALAATPALADDSSAIHGFADISFQNDYITPRGLMVTNKGLTTQVLDGLVFLLPGNAALVDGTWNDIDSAQHSPTSGAWNEFDWFAGANIKVFDKLKLGAQFVQFNSPPGNFHAENNIEFSASYDDTGSLGALSLQPYAKFFYAVSGSSTVVTGKQGGTFDVELGIVPTWDLHPQGVPAILTMPTWVTVGPDDYWGGNDDVGVFSTGLTAKIPIEPFGPHYGNWYLKLGVQYYDFINKELQIAQTLIGTAPASGGHKDATLLFTGFGFSF